VGTNFLAYQSLAPEGLSQGPFLYFDHFRLIPYFTTE
jgi:hypothetical protein